MDADKIARIKERVKKLLATAAGKANEHESANAAAAAAALIARYGIEVSLDDDHREGSSKPIKAEVFERYRAYDGKGPIGNWELILANVITTQASITYIYLSGKQSHWVDFVGPVDECAMAADIYSWLIGQVRALQEESRLSQAAARKAAGQEAEYKRGAARYYWNGWRTGCANRIAERLREAGKEAQKALKGEMRKTLSGPEGEKKYELAVVSMETRPARINDWVKATMKLGTGIERSSGARDGYGEGYKAGNKAQLNGKLLGGS